MSSMGRFLFSLGLFMVLVTLFVGVAAKPRTDQHPAVVYRGAVSQIDLVYKTVQSELEGSTNSISEVLEYWDSEDGLYFFRLINHGSHVAVALNPDLTAWRIPTARTNEIAAYWPITMTNLNRDVGVIAVHFGGGIDFISEAPKWQPVSIK